MKSKPLTGEDMLIFLGYIKENYTLLQENGNDTLKAFRAWSKLTKKSLASNGLPVDNTSVVAIVAEDHFQMVRLILQQRKELEAKVAETCKLHRWN